MRKDFQEALWVLATKLGALGRHLREVEAISELCVGQFVTMLERLAEGRASDVRGAAEQLARANFAVVSAAFARMAEQDAELKTGND